MVGWTAILVIFQPTGNSLSLFLRDVKSAKQAAPRTRRVAPLPLFSQLAAP